MKSIVQEDNDTTDTTEMAHDFELEMRRRAKKIAAEVFPTVKADFRLIEKVVQEIIITDENGFVEEAISEETYNLLTAREWARRAYGDDGPEATFAAYEVANETTDWQREYEIKEKLDELLSKVKRK